MNKESKSVLKKQFQEKDVQRLRNLKQEHLFEKLQCLSIKAAKKAKQSKDKFKDVKIAGCLPPLEGSYKKN